MLQELLLREDGCSLEFSRFLKQCGYCAVGCGVLHKHRIFLVMF